MPLTLHCSRFLKAQGLSKIFTWPNVSEIKVFVQTIDYVYSFSYITGSDKKICKSIKYILTKIGYICYH